jgi:hypothetical protein
VGSTLSLVNIIERSPIIGRWSSALAVNRKAIAVDKPDGMVICFAEKGSFRGAVCHLTRLESGWNVGLL